MLMMQMMGQMQNQAGAAPGAAAPNMMANVRIEKNFEQFLFIITKMQILFKQKFAFLLLILGNCH
jgi:hypothetical protein